MTLGSDGATAIAPMLFTERNLAVGDVLPMVAVVGASPHTAVHGTHVKEVRILRYARNSDDTPADERADVTPMKFAHQR